MRIRTALVCTIVAVLTTALPVIAQDDDAAQKTAEAKAAASDWIAQIDTAAYALSYQTAAPLVQESVSEEQWIEGVKSARDQTGELEARTFADANYTTSLPNAPEGEYVLIQYQSMFANVPRVHEIVVMRRTQDGSWKSVGYRLAPVQSSQN